jgi:hypothetical protein
MIVTLLPVSEPENRAPTIFTPTHAQEYATQDIQIEVNVTDDSAVSMVILSYSNDSKLTWHNVTMSTSYSGPPNWTSSGIIPPQDIETRIYYRIYAQDDKGTWALNDDNGTAFELWTGSRKAFIVCSANDFAGSSFEDDFNNGSNATFISSTEVHWYSKCTFMSAVPFAPQPGHSTSGAYVMTVQAVTGNKIAELTYNWTERYKLQEYAYYNLTAWVMAMGVGFEARLGLQWLNSANQEVRTDWSERLMVPTMWVPLEVTGVCNNMTGNEITQLKLLFTTNTTTLEDGWEIYLDDVRLERWVTANLTHPFDPGMPPPARNINCDGFPAQALQVYKILKSHGYSDANIFFMLYYLNDADGVIDIVSGDGIANDLDGTVQIDLANGSVTANRVKQELNISSIGSFASTIQPNDQLIIYMTDHGSNAILADKNATFHFEADQSILSEFEFYDLVSQIQCWRMMINIDCCFSGNFLNGNSSIGLSWYNLTNCIFVSAAANVLSWYWVDCNNGDLFAGSWFFHHFWDQLDQNQTIWTAFNFAQGVIPAGKGSPLLIIQKPMIQDNLGIKNSWSFTSFSKL